MEQKVQKKSKKQLWSVYVLIRTSPNAFREYLYLNVAKLYKKEGMLYVTDDKKEMHILDASRIEIMKIREHINDGRIQS